MRQIQTTALALLTGVLMCGPLSAAVLIDDFSLPTPSTSFQIGNDPNPTSINTVLSANLSRAVALAVNPNGLPAAFNSLSGGVGGGIFAASYSAVANGQFSIDYLFAAPVDLLEGGANVALDIVAAASSGGGAPIDLSLLIATTAGNLTLNTTMAQSNVFTSRTYNFSTFSGTGNLAQVTGLSLIVGAPNGTSVLLDSVSAVSTPEPGTALSLLLALPVMAALRRRR